MVVTGLFMTVRGGLGFGRRRWLTLHQIIGALILLNAALILVPVRGELVVTIGFVPGAKGQAQAMLFGRPAIVSEDTAEKYG